MTSIATKTCFATAIAKTAGITPKVQIQAVAATVAVVHDSCFSRNCKRSGPRSSTATNWADVGGTTAFIQLDRNREIAEKQAWNSTHAGPRFLHQVIDHDFGVV